MIEQALNNNSVITYTKKLGLLFILSYLFLYMFPFPLGDLPVISDLFNYYDKTTQLLTLWVGHHLLGLITIQHIDMNGSGDTTFDYVKLLTTVIVSVIASIVIFAFTFRKTNYEKLHEYITIYARYYVGLYLLVYGFAKLFDGQFSFPDISRMEETYGNSSPMGLLWTFMGYSKSYTAFCGISEILGGLLLFFRRTIALGSLVSLFVMLNVAMLNFSYDVPVKLFSIHLVLISFFLLFPNLKNIFNYFVLHKTSTICITPFEWSKKWIKYVRISLKALIIIGFSASMIIQIANNTEEEVTHPTLNGAYLTQEFFLNSDTLPYQKKDSLHWSKMFFEYNQAKIVFANNKSVYYKTNIDTVKKAIGLSSYRDSTKKYTLMYRQLSDSTFFMTGKYKTDSISVAFKRKLKKDYLLVKRGFHWINEYPFNR